MLRASSEFQGRTVAVRGIVDPAAASVGVEHQDLLIAFAEAVVRRDDSALARLRNELVGALGAEALVEAAAVAGNFERMNRIADGCGISLGVMEVVSEDIREELDIDHFGSAANTKPIRGLKRLALNMMMPIMMKRMLRPPEKTAEE